MKKAWTCTIGYADGETLPGNADGIMRQAVIRAFHELTGRYPAVAYTGWGGQLSHAEQSELELPRCSETAYSDGTGRCILPAGHSGRHFLGEGPIRPEGLPPHSPPDDPVITKLQ